MVYAEQVGCKHRPESEQNLFYNVFICTRFMNWGEVVEDVHLLKSGAAERIAEFAMIFSGKIIKALLIMPLDLL